MPPDAPFLTAEDVRRQLAFSKLDSVYRLIARGFLVASNVSTGTGRPCWRISSENLAKFLADRQAVPPPTKTERRTRQRKLAEVTEYF
jgi:hypothetical protein